MSWGLLLLLALVVFCYRAVFLEPGIPVRLAPLVREALNYSAPCLLTAICGPIILLQQQTLRPFPENPYLWGAIASVVIAWWIRQTLLAVVASLGVFYLLCLGLL
ncbi:AzlD domain-containing protein [Dickeya lacustris]|uniref:AzlD domain-containing protein n=1 Tax=Dickeya lacustris TaxID=2259638 RepID=A0ABY8G9V8_9GAMM|nr:AzlD domain-containing protein [Dickeya lacustris]WFN56733.1 AzlD domain-containing protein [Dickeya lacustris]